MNPDQVLLLCFETYKLHNSIEYIIKRDTTGFKSLLSQWTSLTLFPTELRSGHN